MQGPRICGASQQGFTLIETLIVTIMIGVIGLVVMSIFSLFASMSAQEYSQRQLRINGEIASAMEAWAASHGTTTDQLPPPYSAGSYKSAVLDPNATDAGTTALMDYLHRRGIDMTQVVNDGSASQNVRAYQRLDGLTDDLPLFGVSGPTVRLTYQLGVIYATDCAFPCANSLPGSSPQLTYANRNQWAVSGHDVGAAFVSTLSVERMRMGVTVERLRRIGSAMNNYFNLQKVSAAPTDMTNWFPAAGATVSGSSYSMGCAGSWSNLSLTQLNLLGLSVTEYSTTAWGSPIQYCRDFAPDGSAANTVPHYAALRIHANPSAGTAPVNTVCTAANYPNCSVLVTF